MAEALTLLALWLSGTFPAGPTDPLLRASQEIANSPTVPPVTPPAGSSNGVKELSSGFPRAPAGVTDRPVRDVTHRMG